VPDADDTAGALIALKNLGKIDDRVKEAAAAGMHWLSRLQNRDCGIPTFCKGWGKLPFDRSSNDLTAHVFRAVETWADVLDRPFKKVDFHRWKWAVSFLNGAQEQDGSWLPLWFGNQHIEGEVNPTYGTSRVLLATAGLWSLFTDDRDSADRGFRWLLNSQNPDGGWGSGHGTPSSIEETALALESLAAEFGICQCSVTNATPDKPASQSDIDLLRWCVENLQPAIECGVSWMVESTQNGTTFTPAPIGFYFAKLWYWEKLYPLIWTVAALGRAVEALVPKSAMDFAPKVQPSSNPGQRSAT
jgi:squalene-hopene/tetraprenyl-beta-curcumene cyclase